MNTLSVADPFALEVASHLLDLLRQGRTILYPGGKAFYLRPGAAYLTVIFDPAMLNQKHITDELAHQLSTRLGGRPVVRANSRGLFFLIGYETPRTVDLSPRPLDLRSQPTPWDLPIGVTARGHLWIKLQDGDSYLVGGVRGMGKSGLLHGFIQALLHGGRTLVYAQDGKDEAEYLRYYGVPNFHLMPTNDLQAGLAELGIEVARRMTVLTQSGHANIITYNDANSRNELLPIALVIDEVAFIRDQDALTQLVARYRAAGVYPIFATNNPSKAGVIAKSNLATRISFPVVSYNDSSTILGHTGAHRLPKRQGRGLIVHEGRLVEFQAFQVKYPAPSDAAYAWLQQRAEIADIAAQAADPDEERVRELIGRGESNTAIVRAVWKVYGGGQFQMLVDRVKGIRASTSTSEVGVLGENLPETGCEVEVVVEKGVEA